MASGPHDKSGRKCSVCGVEFTLHSYVGTLTRLRPVTCEFDGETKTKGYQIPQLVCQKCHNDHFSRGE
jgi:hypothetical protein